MILFHSEDGGNVGRALVDHVWQTRLMPSCLTIGDPVFLNIKGKSKIRFLGVVDKITREQLHDWPENFDVIDPNSVPTIYIRPVERDDFRNMHGGFNYKKRLRDA